MNIPITLDGEYSALTSAFAEFGRLIEGRNLQFEVDCSVELHELFRQILVDGLLDASKLICIHSKSSADLAGYVLLSFEPSPLFLELLSALRAGDGNDF